MIVIGKVRIENKEKIRKNCVVASTYDFSNAEEGDTSGWWDDTRTSGPLLGLSRALPPKLN